MQISYATVPRFKPKHNKTSWAQVDKLVYFSPQGQHAAMLPVLSYTNNADNVFEHDPL